MKRIITSIIIIVTLSISCIVNAQEIENIENMNPALLVIDVQKVYFNRMDQSDVDKPIEVINKSIEFFDDQNLPIIYIYHRNNTSDKHQYIDEIEVPENATKVLKNYGNAFKKTELNDILKKLYCNTLYLCGLSATACVKATYQGANDLDYNTFLIKDANMSPSKKKTSMIEDEFKAVDIESVKEIISIKQ